MMRKTASLSHSRRAGSFSEEEVRGPGFQVLKEGVFEVALLLMPKP